MMEDVIESLLEVVVIVGIFAGPALVWHRLVTGSRFPTDPDLG